MKVLPFKIQKPNDEALVYQEDSEQAFYDKLHQHEEYQISLIAEGEGTLVVGDSISQYKKGDVLVIGSGLPHVFKSEIHMHKQSLMLSLFFTDSSFGNSFFDLDELKRVESFFKRAQSGFKAKSHLSQLHELIEQLSKASKFERFVLFLKLLELLSKCQLENLSHFIYEKQYSDLEGKRMSRVLEFTMNNFQNQINLDQVSKVATLTKNAFSTYFKKRTNKTYVQFLNELRIEKACRSLQANQDLSIAAIAESVGFNNISNFNRRFKILKKMSPKEYRSMTIL